MLRRIAARIRAMMNRQVEDQELREELEAHVAMLAEAKIQQGLGAEEAERQARIEVGGITQLQEAHREVRGLPMVETLTLDLRYALRSMRKDMALSTFVILILAIGVGASATIFGVASALWIRPLPFPEAGRLVWIANGSAENLSKQSVQAGHLWDLQAQSQTLAGVEGFSPFYGVGDIRLTDRGEAARVTGVPVTKDFFGLLGVKPWLGRYFSDEESRWGAPRSAVLSHAFWQTRLGASKSVVGSTILLDGIATAVVGVLPPGFDFSRTFTPGRPADMFFPFPLTAENNRRGNTLALIGRLKPEVLERVASAEIAALAERFQREAPEVEPGRRRNSFRPMLSPLQKRISGKFESILALLGSAAGLLLLLVSANISSLLLARASVRRKEVAMRMALGASRGRVFAQMLVEGLVLSGSGAALGLVIAFNGTRFVASLDNVGIPLLHEVHIDGMAIAFLSLLAVATGVGFSVLPAMQATGASAQEALREFGRGMAGGGGFMRRALVVAEIGLVSVLLVGTGLLTRSLLQVLAVDPGFRSQNVVTLRVDPARRASVTQEQRNAYFDNVVQRVRASSGVEAVGLTDALPLGDNFGWRGWTVTASDRFEGGVPVRANPLVRMVDSGYFEAMRIPIQAGRGFRPGDGPASERVIVLNESLAQALWPNADPLGREVKTSGKAYRVVGVVQEVRYFDLERDTSPEMYMLLGQTGDFATVDLVVKGSIPSGELIPVLRQALRQADPTLPTLEFRTMDQLLERSTFLRRLLVILLGGFAGFGLLLSALGLYAVISYSVAQRRREIGVRMALGATPMGMQGTVLAETMWLVVVGLGLGLPVAWLASRAMRHLLFGVVGADPLTFFMVGFVVVTIGVIGGYLPARRASRVDPMEALRVE